MSVDSIIENARESSQFSSLRFPQDIGPTCMVFNFYEYSYAGAGGGTGFSSRARLSDSVILPLPINLENSYGIRIQEAELGALGALAVNALTATNAGEAGAAFNAAGAAIQQGMASAESMGAGIASGDYSGVVDFMRGASFFARSSIDGLFPGAGMALDVATGTTVNPQQTLAFNGVDLKNFTFNWALAPKNRSDSDALRQIERKFKQHILPSYRGLSDTNSALDRAFLGYPDLVEIFFKGIDPNYYFEFKPGMVSNFTINYSPNGNVILEGGRPASITMSMTFKEARIHTRQDYGGSSPGPTAVSSSSPTSTPSQTTAAPAAAPALPPQPTSSNSGPF